MLLSCAAKARQVSRRAEAASTAGSPAAAPCQGLARRLRPEFPTQFQRLPLTRSLFARSSCQSKRNTCQAKGCLRLLSCRVGSWHSHECLPAPEGSIPARNYGLRHSYSYRRKRSKRRSTQPLWNASWVWSSFVMGSMLGLSSGVHALSLALMRSMLTHGRQGQHCFH